MEVLRHRVSPFISRIKTSERPKLSAKKDAALVAPEVKQGKAPDQQIPGAREMEEKLPFPLSFFLTHSQIT